MGDYKRDVEMERGSFSCIFFHSQSFSSKFCYFDISAILTGNDASNRLNISKFVISRSISIKIDTSFALFQIFVIGRHFGFFSEKAIRHNWRKLLTDETDFQ